MGTEWVAAEENKYTQMGIFVIIELLHPAQSKVHNLPERVLALAQKQAGRRVKRELEADYIGLMIMGSVGYDPRVAPTFYKSLPEESYSSTHPSGSRRSDMLNRPKVMGKAVAIHEQVQAGKGVESFHLRSTRAKSRATGKTTLLVHHEALDRRVKSKELGELVVRARHIHTTNGAKHEVSCSGRWGSITLDNGIVGK
ncbi:hypothetical protein RJ640_012214 [Escallonia rubra]|uniref:Peptidase M48 domain-containing protein n=1 Tax=Escallonia rubra TaxID=112253 RepID=A0AA88R6T2_9ASTE|nr:hypothetical protein RJ640_012214 [Escallonia rubra]